MTLRPGKLPAAMLGGLLARIPHRDPRVLLGAGIGRDAAVIDMGGGRVLVAKTDPVTFAAEDIGWYAVNVNANDIACMGARPAWFMATALLPPGADDGLPGRIFDQIVVACSTLDIELVGGHTEVTFGLDRPIVVGAMLGEASRQEIVTGENIEAGDVVVLAKGIAIEGTALLAREAARTLAERGLSNELIEGAQRMLFEPGISVVSDTKWLTARGRPRLMHDPTEGGLATALEEMALAAGATLRIYPDRVPVFEETRMICSVLGLDPLGLLASGALLAIISAEHDRRLAAGEGKSRCEMIGRVEHGPPRVILGDEDPAVPMVKFARDEFARFFERAQGAGGYHTGKTTEGD